MSDVEWDADDFEPPQNRKAAPTDKWEGEDEEDEIKDNWDDEDEDKDRESPTGSASGKIKKKKLADRIAEREAKQQEELERRRKEQEEKNSTQTPEEKLAEKLRIQKIQEDADFQLANELIGNTTADEENLKLLDEIDLSSQEGLDSFRDAVIAKIRSTDRLEKRPFFVTFVEDLSRELCQNLEVEEVKRVSSVLNSLYNEKVKASKPKSKKKSGNKPKLNVAAHGAMDDIGNDYGAEYDDFM